VQPSFHFRCSAEHAFIIKGLDLHFRPPLHWKDAANGGISCTMLDGAKYYHSQTASAGLQPQLTTASFQQRASTRYAFSSVRGGRLFAQGWRSNVANLRVDAFRKRYRSASSWAGVEVRQTDFTV
jgi:hypothetical protein